MDQASFFRVQCASSMHLGACVCTALGRRLRYVRVGVWPWRIVHPHLKQAVCSGTRSTTGTIRRRYPLADWFSSKNAVQAYLNRRSKSSSYDPPACSRRFLSRPRTNTILMGMEIGAFKAANASYLISGSYVVRLRC